VGLIDAPTQDSISQIVASALALATAVVPLIARRHTSSRVREVSEAAVSVEGGREPPVSADVPDGPPRRAGESAGSTAVPRTVA